MDITKLPWWIFALCSTFAVGTYNLFLEGSKKIVPKGLIPKHIFICSILNNGRPVILNLTPFICNIFRIIIKCID